MKYCIAITTLALWGSSLALDATATEKDWTLSTTGSWSQTDASESDAVSGSVSLRGRAGAGSFTVSLGTSTAVDSSLEAFEIEDRSSALGSASIAWPVGAVDVGLSVSYANESYQSRFSQTGDVLDNLDDLDLSVPIDSETIAVSASVSRTFVAGDWDIIPNASIGWSQTTTSSDMLLPEGLSDLGILSQDQTGINGSVGLGIGYIATDKLYLFTDIVGLYAENGAASGIASTGRLDTLRTSAQQTPDATSWAEFSLGASFDATDSLSLSITGGTTAGRDDEEIFAATTLSVNF